MTRRLYRSEHDKVLGGVCGGLGEYLDTDPNLLRVAAVVLALAGFGTGVIAYVVAWIIIPSSLYAPAADRDALVRADTAWYTVIPGVFLVLCGLLLLLGHHVLWFGHKLLWPIILVVIGLFLVVRGWGRRHVGGPYMNGCAPHRQNGGPIS